MLPSYRAALLAAACLPLPALAQEAAPPILVPEVSVTGAIPSLTAPVATTAAERLRQVPGNVTVLPGEEIHARAGVTTLRDVLEYAPGVFAQPKWGEDTRLSIRGSGLSRNFHLRGVQLTQDGVPLNQADGAGDFQELDPLVFGHVEVLRGANAFGLGSATLGGVLNFATPTGRSDPGAVLRGEAGSYGYRRAQAAYGAAAGAVRPAHGGRGQHPQRLSAQHREQPLRQPHQLADLARRGAGPRRLLCPPGAGPLDLPVYRPAHR
ncbi:Plug domain-containing protein [Roseomonas xinghualingensis]|uniref:Plug domain-containing protein n=1 Tax=Roseomonas xinghualingensis TaxID=2986475 RepID=UPI0021F190E2|nr:Plug domain-containing protein [Roseomonas sp. SXEYE001]MCV4208257.1 Plug domain-containing protein [Roseomonas sp. SXEYE001]